MYKYKQKRGHSAFTEVIWYTPKYINFQRSLREDDSSVTLDFSGIEWFDLWPLAQLTKLVFERLMLSKRKLLMEIPYPRRSIAPDEKFKPLCFLVDIGFLGLFVKWGGICRITGKEIRLEHSSESASGLSQNSLSSLEKYGYRRKAYKDQILIPLTPVCNRHDIETIKFLLHDYVGTWLRFCQNEIIDGGFIDIFYRELAENSIEHAKGEIAIVAARLQRSLWDLTEKQRKAVQRIRLDGKMEAMKYFLHKYENDGFLELVIADDGPGIEGTLSIDHIEARKSGGIYRYAMKPDVSQYDVQKRIDLGKSPLTGLGECASCLEHLPGVLMFRESNGGTYCYPETKKKSDLVNLSFSETKKCESEATRGCNVQLALAILPLSLEGSKASIGNQVDPSFSFHSLFSGNRFRLKSIKKEDDFEEFKSDDYKENSKCLIDLSGASADKDTAWHTLKKILSVSKDRKAPVVLVGVTRPFVSRLNDALNKLKYEFNKYKKEFPMIDRPDKIPVGWFALTPDLQLYFIGGTADFSNYIRTYAIEGGFPTIPDKFKKVPEYASFISKYYSNPISLEDIFWSWQAGTENRIMSLANNRGYILKDTCVELPSHNKALHYLNVYDILNDNDIRFLIIGAAEREILRVSPQVIVTYSAPIGRLCNEILRKGIGEIVQIDLPTPYTIASKISSLNHYRLKKTLIFADIINTGSHLSRVVRGCTTAGLNIISAFALHDSHPVDTQPQCHVPYTPLIHFPNQPAPLDKEPIYKVDPYTLAMQKVVDIETSWFPSPRSKNKTIEFYSIVTQQKAIINRHCSNQAGHHFVLAIDFRQLTRKDAQNFLIQQIHQFTKKIKPSALIVTSESIVGSIANEIANKIGLDPSKILYAVESHRIVKEYRLSAIDETKLRKIGSQGGSVIFLDDAVHKGQVMADIISYAAHCGLKKFYAWFILDNRPPNFTMVNKVLYDEEHPLDIHTGALMRSFFPVFSSSYSCPFCKIAEAYHRALQSRPNTLIEEQIRLRLNDMRPINLKLAIIPPWRYATTETISLPQIKGFDGMPDTVNSQETFSLALWELSQYEEGLALIVNVFKEKQFVKHNTLIALILSKNMNTLDKLGIRREYVNSFLETIRNWTEDDCAVLFETSLLWPLEVLVEELPIFLLNMNDAMASSDSFLAVLYTLMQYTIANCGEGDREKILKTMQSVQGNAPKEIITYGVFQSVFSSFTRQPDASHELSVALITLAKRLLIHREPQHQLHTLIPNLVATLTVTHAKEMLGLDSDYDSLNTFAILYYIAELGQSIETLVRVGELNNTKNIDELLTSIRLVMKYRAELRVLWRNNPNLDSQLTEDKLKLIKDNLSKISTLLTSNDSEENVRELFSLLDNRIVNLSTFTNDFYLSLKKEIQRDIIDDNTDNIKNVHILADPVLLLRIISSVTNNVKKYSKYTGLFEKVSINSVVKTDGSCSVLIRNPCTDTDSETKFLKGRDYHSLSAALYRFGAQYTGKYNNGEFVTGIYFTTII